MVFLIGHSWCPHVRIQAGVRMWLDIGHHKSYDGTKCPIKKTPRIKMIVASEHQAKLRQKEIQEIDKKASKEHEEAKKNSNFTQTYPKGWQRIRELVRDKTGCCRYRSLLIFR